MTDLTELAIGSRYTRKSLSEILSISRIATSREGIVSIPQNFLLFVTLEKRNMPVEYKYNDYFEGKYFHWDSQNQQSFRTPRIQQMVSGELGVHLFARRIDKTSGHTHPFIYCGRLLYSEFDSKTANPVHIVFNTVNFLDNPNRELKEIYEWNPMTRNLPTSNSPRISSSKSIERPSAGVSEQRLADQSEPRRSWVQLVNQNVLVISFAVIGVLIVLILLIALLGLF